MINDYSIALSGQAAVDEITVTRHAPFVKKFLVLSF